LVRVTPTRRRPVLVGSKRRRADAQFGRDLRCELRARRSADHGLGHAPGALRERLALGAALEGGQQQAGLLPDTDLGVGASLPHVGKRLDDRRLAMDELLLADGELFLDAPALDGLDPLGGVVDGVDHGVGEPALAVLQAQDERGRVDLQIDPHRVPPRSLPGEAPAGGRTSRLCW
jgi:hypothetical protein